MKRSSITILAMVLFSIGCGEEPTSVTDLPLAPLAPQVGLVPGVPGGNYVPTPAGWWHRSCVHAIPRGAKVLRYRHVRREDGTTYQLPQCRYPAFRHLPVQANAGRGRGPFGGPQPGTWIMDADDELTGSNSYRHLEAKWVVPAKPTGSYAWVLSAGEREPSYYLGLSGPLLRSVRQGGIAYPGGLRLIDPAQ